MQKINYYCLYYDLAQIILPALIEFKEKSISWPGSLESPQEWDEILDKMIYSFTFICKDEFTADDKEWEKIQEGVELFGKWYRDLWS